VRQPGVVTIRVHQVRCVTLFLRFGGVLPRPRLRRPQPQPPPRSLRQLLRPQLRLPEPALSMSILPNYRMAAGYVLNAPRARIRTRYGTKVTGHATRNPLQGALKVPPCGGFKVVRCVWGPAESSRCNLRSRRSRVLVMTKHRLFPQRLLTGFTLIEILVVVALSAYWRQSRSRYTATTRRVRGLPTSSPNSMLPKPRPAPISRVKP